MLQYIMLGDKYKCKTFFFDFIKHIIHRERERGEVKYFLTKMIIGFDTSPITCCCHNIICMTPRVSHVGEISEGK